MRLCKKVVGEKDIVETAKCTGLTATATRGVTLIRLPIDGDRGEVSVTHNQGRDGKEKEEDRVHYGRGECGCRVKLG